MNDDFLEWIEESINQLKCTQKSEDCMNLIVSIDDRLNWEWGFFSMCLDDYNFVRDLYGALVTL